MKYLICKMLLIGILFTNYTVFAQLDKEWEARYMQTGYLDDAAKKVIADENGNSYVLGNSGDDAVLIKYDSDGNLIWSFQAGRGVFMEDDYDAGRDFQIGPSGNIYVVLKGRHEGTYGVSLLKLNNDGELLQHTHMPGAHREGRVSLAIHDDGSLSILSRSGYRGIRLLKLTNTGEEVWSKTFSTSDRSYVQEVRIINNMIVAWYYSGLQTWFRESYLHVYSLDGDLKWEHNYKYESYGTHITGLQLHEEEFIVSYYMNEGASQGFNQIMRYDMSDGTINKSFNVQLDYTFESDEPVSVMYVGDDSFIYLMGDTFLQVRKYSLEGERIWFYEFEWASGTRHHPIAFTVNENDSSANVLIRTEYFNNPQDTYRLVKFNADKTYNVLANIRGLQKDFIPVSFTQTGSDFLVAGAFDNGVFEKDLLVAKFTKTNARIWEASFEPVNSERHEPTCMVLDEDGNVYVGGRVAVGPKSNGFGLIKYSPTGEQLWATTLVPDEKNGSQEAYRTMITALDLTPDGNIVATGVVQLGDGRFIIDTPVEMYTTKINSDGEILWTSKTSSEDDNHLIGLQVVVDDNNIYTLGSACQFNRNDDEASPMVLVKYDLSGNEIWERRFFFSSCHSNIGDSHLPDSQRPLIEVVNDKIYVVSTKFKKLELRTFDTDGNETLIKELGCSECHRQFYYVHGLHIEPSGDIYLAYGDYQPYKEFQGTVTKLSPTGATIWSTTRSYDDENTFPYDGSFAFDNSNNIYLINASPTELNYSKIDPEGNEIWTKSELLKGHS
ncbi:MAG: PQQ-binding-like beta-propeller repeat protein, partial [Bacteroidota bacterium]